MIPTLTDLTLEIHIVLFVGLIIASILAGYFIGGSRITRKEKKNFELENEMIASHKEILKNVTTIKHLTETLEKAKISIPHINEKTKKFAKFI